MQKVPEGARAKLKDISGIVDERSKGEIIAENSKDAKDTTLYDQYADLRKLIKNTSIRLSDADKADVGDYEAFSKIKKLIKLFLPE